MLIEAIPSAVFQNLYIQYPIEQAQKDGRTIKWCSLYGMRHAGLKNISDRRTSLLFVDSWGGHGLTDDLKATWRKVEKVYYFQFHDTHLAVRPWNWFTIQKWNRSRSTFQWNHKFEMSREGKYKESFGKTRTLRSHFYSVYQLTVFVKPAFSESLVVYDSHDKTGFQLTLVLGVTERCTWTPKHCKETMQNYCDRYQRWN